MIIKEKLKINPLYQENYITGYSKHKRLPKHFYQFITYSSTSTHLKMMVISPLVEAF